MQLKSIWLQRDLCKKMKIFLFYFFLNFVVYVNETKEMQTH